MPSKRQVFVVEYPETYWSIDDFAAFEYHEQDPKRNGVVRIHDTKGLVVKTDGMSKSNDTLVHRWVDDNTFETIPVKVNTKKMKKKKLSPSLIKELFFDPAKTRLNKSNPDYARLSLLHRFDKKYYIHFNGGRPFLVYVSGNNVSVYKRPETTHFISMERLPQPWMYTQLVSSFRNYKHVFVPYKPNRTRLFVLPRRSKWYLQTMVEPRGNTILVLLQDGKTYVHIGVSIFSFRIPPDDTIVNYFSPIIGSDVPHPYAVGHKYVYPLFINQERHYYPKENEQVTLPDVLRNVEGKSRIGKPLLNVTNIDPGELVNTPKQV